MDEQIKTGDLKKWIWIIIIVIIIIIIALLSKNSKKEDVKIRVGAVLPLSGASAMFGEEMKKGMEMCNPGNISYLYEDSIGAAATGVAAYNKLINIDKVKMSIVGMSTVVPAILPIAKENKDFVITTIVTAAGVGKNGGDGVFRYYINGYDVGQIIADSMLKNNAKKIGILYVQNEYGETYRNGAMDFLKDKDVLIYTESILATDTDTSTSLLKLKQKGVDSILVVAYDKQTLQIVSKVKDLKLNINIYGAWMWSDKDLKDNSQVLEGIMIPRSLYLFGSNEKAAKFNQEFKTKFGSEGNQFAAIGCDLSILIGENNISTAEQMRNLKKFSGINGDITQKAYGELDFPVKMIQYSEGVVKTLK